MDLQAGEGLESGQLVMVFGYIVRHDLELAKLTCTYGQERSQVNFDLFVNGPGLLHGQSFACTCIEN